MTAPYITDRDVRRVLADVPDRNLAAHQATRQAMCISGVKLQLGDRVRRLYGEIRDGEVLWKRGVLILIVCIITYESPKTAVYEYSRFLYHTY